MRKLIDSPTNRIALVSLAELRSHASDTKQVLRGAISSDGLSCFRCEPESNSLYDFAELFPRSKEFAHIADFDRAHLRWRPPDTLLQKAKTLGQKLCLNAQRGRKRQITLNDEGHAIAYSKILEIVTNSLTGKPLPEKIYKRSRTKRSMKGRLNVLIAVDTSASILWDNPQFLENSIAEQFALRRVFQKYGHVVRAFACMDVEDSLYNIRLKSGFAFEIGNHIADLVPFVGRESLRLHILLHMIKLSEQDALDWLGVRQYNNTRDFESTAAKASIQGLATAFKPDILIAYTNAAIDYKHGTTWRLGINTSIDDIIGVL